MKAIDLRSDTAALPTREMFDAMWGVEPGDDVLGEDINVSTLEQIGASMFGQEAALLVSTGSMANQIAVMVYTKRGQEVIVGAESHMYNLEGAGLAALSQVQARPVSCPKGYFDPARVASAIRGTGVQSARTGLICLENTYNLNRGYVMSLQNIAEISSLAAKNSIPVYMDGARIFNAAAALGIEVENITRHVDAVQLCLTKGLGAPFGALLMGRKEFIQEARIVRQRIGGGIRHVGILAAAGLVALRNMVVCHGQDNENAKHLATGLAAIDSRLLDLNEVQTNIVSIDVGPLGLDAAVFNEKLLAAGIKIKLTGTTCFRMVCYHNIDRGLIETALKGINVVIGDMMKSSRNGTTQAGSGRGLTDWP